MKYTPIFKRPKNPADARIESLERRFDVLEAQNDNARKMLWAWLGHLKILMRWPCSECGRTDSDQPLKMNLLIQEDGSEQHVGCQACNNDALIAQTEKILNG